MTAVIDDIEITGLSYDSRQVKPGHLFAALSGLQHDGHQFINQAIEQGAVAILGSQQEIDCTTPYIQSAHTRATLGEVASRFYGEPTTKIPVIGLTGTNGKTTCTYLIEAILIAAGYSPAIIGTINYRHGSHVQGANHTTPEAPDLQAWIAARIDAGADILVMEVSSHAIALERVRGCHFDVAAFTNLTQDHLDFHDSLEDYFATKARLFNELLPASKKTTKHAILNGDDPQVAALAKELKVPTQLCSQHKASDYSVVSQELSVDGIQAILQSPQGLINIKSPLVGDYNLQNILIAVACCQSLGVETSALEQGIATMKGVPGRVERVLNPQGHHIFVDYAHTPDALKRVLLALRPHATQRLITVFGCGGDRDTGKRPLMGNMAARLSDVVIVTSDNPRTEDPEQIIQQIIPGIAAEKTPSYSDKEQRGVLVESDRRQAIFKAVALAQAGDMILIAGKGHENYQILGTEKIHFDDREVALAACEALR